VFFSVKYAFEISVYYYFFAHGYKATGFKHCAMRDVTAEEGDHISSLKGY